MLLKMGVDTYSNITALHRTYLIFDGNKSVFIGDVNFFLPVQHLLPYNVKILKKEKV
jgi:hypothetical protein